MDKHCEGICHLHQGSHKKSFLSLPNISLTVVLPHIQAATLIYGWDDVPHERNELMNIRKVYLKKRRYTQGLLTFLEKMFHSIDMLITHSF